MPTNSTITSSPSFSRRKVTPVENRDPVLNNNSCDVTKTIETVTTKLQWATNELAHDTSIENSIKLCELIKSCGETLKTLQSMKPETTG